MTISLKLHVNGAYEATVHHSVNGAPAGEPVVVKGGEGEKSISFQHGAVNTYEITEEYVGDRAKPTEPAPGGDSA